MTPIPWDTDLETGDALVDEQHRNIFSLINEVEALETDDVAAILSIVERVMAHVDTHFTTEEKLMLREGYPREAFERHRIEHQKLTDRARTAALGFRGSWDITRGPFVELLRVWLLGHIEDEDRAMVDHMRKKGASAKTLFRAEHPRPSQRSDAPDAGSPERPQFAVAGTGTGAGLDVPSSRRTRRRRRELPTTSRLLDAIAIAAIAGVITPSAASGSATAL